MTHIANCMRASALNKSHVYISDQASSGAITLEPERPDSRAATPDSRSERPDSRASRREASVDRSFPTRRAQPKYQLWPSNKSPVFHNRPHLTAEKAMALSVKRSATAMGDAIVTSDNSMPRSRTGSLSNRRKVSVPDLQPPPPMTTLQESCMDSPTIPGRPPVARPIYEMKPIYEPGHERSPSAPMAPMSAWRTNPFGDAMMSCVTGPAPVAMQKPVSPKSQPVDSNRQDIDLTLPVLRPLSPILSPTAMEKPNLQINTAVPAAADDDDDIPPAVPPKSPSLYKRSPVVRQQPPRNDSGAACTPITEAPAPLKSITGNVEWSSPESLDKRENWRAHVRKYSEDRPKLPDEKTQVLRKMRSEQSLMDRGRPVAKSKRALHSRKGSSASCSDKESGDTWKLPKGLPTAEAATKLSIKDKERLRQKAGVQAEKFEVLNSRDVHCLSRELRALDERCEYLRKTYRSLREGRQKLHTRMISYLKRSETVVFSRENLLKQEEALVELDLSIDDWILKIEQAENRRQRIRQKLLEHIAAAMALPPVISQGEAAEATPPRSPIKEEKAESPSRVERKDVESIKIYADGHVLSLFSEVEQAIGQMCEGTA